MRRTLALCLLLACAPPAFAQHGLEPIDIGAFHESLQSAEGVVAEVHGVDPQTGLHVMVYRQDSFFRYLHFPAIADEAAPDFEEMRTVLDGLGRHDRVRVRGRFHPDIVAPMEHVLLTRLEVLDRYDRGDLPPYRYAAELPEDLAGTQEALFKVHAVLDEGRTFVVEYADVNVPFVSARPEQTGDLYRGDLVRIAFRIAQAPERPPHLAIARMPDAVEVVDRLVDQHGETHTHCGALAMFPESPQVLFDVFAISVALQGGYSRTYTLLPEEFEDEEAFARLRARLQEVWEARAQTIERARNHLVNPAIEACATGTIAMIDRNQANPQIFLADFDDLRIE